LNEFCPIHQVLLVDRVSFLLDAKMPQKIDRETVLEVARLARINLPVESIPQVQRDLVSILDYVGQLSQITIPSDTVPFFGVAEETNAVRQDQVEASYSRSTMVQNAPATDGEFYLVPPVFR
jgi:aspartyl-tRNA(Asn)/glutamyl-tRNA(Gln) amidotransferase subunit C